MLRPIDTQTILQQTQEIANRQQAANNKDQMLQHQFSNILTKQVQEKNETVSNVSADEKLRNNTHVNEEKKNSRFKSLQKKKSKKKSSKKSDSSPSVDGTRFDVRI